MNSTGWHSTKKRKARSDGDPPPSNDDWKRSLPLAWTRLTKSDLCPPRSSYSMSSSSSSFSKISKRQSMMSSRDIVTTKSTTKMTAATTTRSKYSPSKPTQPPTNDNSSSSSSNNNNKSSITSKSSTTIVQGHAIFCLHDWNPSWVQGYFVPASSSAPFSSSRGCSPRKPWRLLGVQEEIDECLECTDGGYRRLTLTVYHDTVETSQSSSSSLPITSSSSSSSSTTTTSLDASTTQSSSLSPTTTQRKRKRSKKTKFYGVEWTGGDMMDLYNVDKKLDMMKADKLLSGTQCLEVLSKYFEGLIRQLRRSCGVDDDVDVLDFLPNIAIVIGSMSLPVHPKNTDDNGDDYDDFLDDL